MSRYGTILGGAASASSYVVQSADAEGLLNLAGAAGLATFGSMTDPVITSLTLTGAGDGHMFFLAAEGCEASDADGGASAQTLSASVFLGATAEGLAAAIASPSVTGPILDVQIAGAAKGQRVMCLVISGTLRGGGGGGLNYPNRLDASVNNGRVENPYSANPILHCQSGGNVAGGFNGGGTGNKCILGYDVGNLLPLGAFTGFDYTWRDLAPYISGLPVYANLVIDVNGNGTAYKIGVVDPASPLALGNGSTVTNLDGSFTTTFNAATQNLLIVNGLPTVLPGVGPPYVPPTVAGAAPPTYGFTAGWGSSSYSIAAILAAYPNARLARAASGDGGLPVSPNVTPALMLITGDAINQRIRSFQLSSVRFNGVLV